MPKPIFWEKYLFSTKIRVHVFKDFKVPKHGERPFLSCIFFSRRQNRNLRPNFEVMKCCLHTVLLQSGHWERVREFTIKDMNKYFITELQKLCNEIVWATKLYHNFPEVFTTVHVNSFGQVNIACKNYYIFKAF